MKKLIVILLVLLPALVSAQMISPARMNQEIVDLRSYAMGKTAIISARGSNAVFSNPAMIGSLEGMHFAAGGRMFYGSIDNSFMEEISKDMNSKYSEKNLPHYGFSSASFSFSTRTPDSDLNFSFGAGLHTYLDSGLKNEIIIESDAGNKMTIINKMSGGITAITPTVAINYKDKQYLGISINKSISGKLSSSSIMTNSVLDFENTQEWESNNSASFVIISSMVKVTPTFNVGFTFRPKFTWKLKKYDITEYINGAKVDTTERDGDVLEFPNEYGIAFDYQLMENILLAGEIQEKKFSQYASRIGNINVSNGRCYRFGAEVLLGSIPVRIGIFKDAIPMRDWLNDEPVVMTGFTGGFSYTAWRGITIDTAFQRCSWDQQYIQNLGYSESTYTFRFGVSYKM
jgi:hypothetical protein